MTDAKNLADKGKFSEAKTVLETAIQKITASVSVGEQFCQGLLNDLVRAGETMRSQVEYKSHGAHYLMSK